MAAEPPAPAPIAPCSPCRLRDITNTYANPVPHRLRRPRRVRPRHSAAAVLCGAVWCLAAAGDDVARGVFADADARVAAVGAPVRPDRAPPGVDRQPCRFRAVL